MQYLNKRDNWEDWVCYDFDMTQVPYENVTDAKAAFGFYKIWNKSEDSFQSIMMPHIKSLLRLHNNTNDCTMLVTGHSLGAAVASFAALTIDDYIEQESIVCDLQVYTYGQPRWGNDAMIEYYESKLSNNKKNFRVTNERDPVPHLPFG